MKPVGALYDDEPASQLPVLEIAAARSTLLPTLIPVYFQASLWSMDHKDASSMALTPSVSPCRKNRRL